MMNRINSAGNVFIKDYVIYPMLTYIYQDT